MMGMSDDDATTGTVSDGRVRQFLAGLWYPARALRLLVTSLSLLKFAVLPMLINVAVFVLGFVVGGRFWGDFIARFQPSEQTWFLAALMWVAWILAWILGFVLYLLICFLLFTLLGNLIAAPFVDLLSERAEERLLGTKDETPFSFKLFLHDTGLLLLEEGRKVLTWLVFMVCILPLLLIPMVGQVAFVVLSTSFSVYFLGLAFVDFPLARRRMPFALKREFAWRNRWRLLGLGAAIYVTLLVPVVGFACLPISAVAGTWLFCEHATEDERRSHGPAPRPSAPPAPGD